MSQTSRLSLVVMFLCTASGLAGCATLGGPVAGSGARLPYPDWVKAGSRAGQSSQDKALFGLGEVRGIRNVALARATADNRARAELAQLLDVFVERWLLACSKEVAALTQGAQAAAPLDLAALTRLLTASNLSAVQIVEHYFHPNDGSVFSLARLDLSHIEQHLLGSADVPAPIKHCLAEHSASAFAQLNGRLSH